MPDTIAAMALLEARIDKLTEALFHVASELWATRDRQTVLEHLLAQEGITAPGLIDGYHPDEPLAQRLEAEREALVSGILGYLAPDS